MIFEGKDKVSASRCDCRANLSLIGMTEGIQDNVCYYFDSLGIDQITLRNKLGCMWVFVKNKVRVFAPLKWNETFNVKCFISAVTPVRIIVDTQFIKTSGEVALYAKTEVCLLDITSGRIQKLTDKLVGVDLSVTEPEQKFDFERIDDEGETKQEFTVKSSNIDYCRHVNNAEYVRFITDAFSVKELEERDIKSFEIHYVRQSLEGALLTVKRRDDKNVSDVAVKNGEKVAAISRIIFG